LLDLETFKQIHLIAGLRDNTDQLARATQEAVAERAGKRIQVAVFCQFQRLTGNEDAGNWAAENNWENASVHNDKPPGSFGYVPIDDKAYPIETPLPQGLHEYAKSLVDVEAPPAVHH
jgi:hypothetical protein